MTYKLALNVGHYKHSAGKRCPKALDTKETSEWELCSRIADKTEQLLNGYDIEILRTDDRSGETNIPLADRTDKANKFKANSYISLHANGLFNDGRTHTASGITAYVYTKPQAESLKWQKELYDALVSKTGLKGDRITPLAKKNLHEVRETTMPATLLELGFMDSVKDSPIIQTQKFADQCAEAIADVVIRLGKLTKKPPETEFWVVQAGVYSNREYADNQAARLKAAGFEAYVFKRK